MNMEFREQYSKALELLGRAVEAMLEQGLDPPILVGGGAVEFYTSGAIFSGDFDIVTASQEAFERALFAEGFRKEDRPDRLLRGYYHPELVIGIEIVGSRLLDGNADRSRIALVTIGPDSRVAIIAVEDIIADRMGQFSSTPVGVPEMLDQAAVLFSLAPEIDENYLDARIKQETSGQFDLAFLRTHRSKP
jgi:hypothetical protein